MNALLMVVLLFCLVIAVAVVVGLVLFFMLRTNKAQQTPTASYPPSGV